LTRKPFDKVTTPDAAINTLTVKSPCSRHPLQVVCGGGIIAKDFSVFETLLFFLTVSTTITAENSRFILELSKTF
jgi:hypothetical protein